MEIKKVGEAVDFECTVYDIDGEVPNLSGATATFYLGGVWNGVLLSKDCNIAGNVLSVSLLPQETGTHGKYVYEFWIDFNGTPYCVKTDFVVFDVALKEVPLGD